MFYFFAAPELTETPSFISIAWDFRLEITGETPSES